MLKAKQLLVTHKTVLLLFPSSSNTDVCTHCQNWQLFTIHPITHAITQRLKTSSLICVTLSCSGWGDLILIGLLFKSCFLQKLGDKFKRWPDKMLAVQKSSRWISEEKNHAVIAHNRRAVPPLLGWFMKSLCLVISSQSLWDQIIAHAFQLGGRGR